MITTPTGTLTVPRRRDPPPLGRCRTYPCHPRGPAAAAPMNGLAPPNRANSSQNSAEAGPRSVCILALASPQPFSTCLASTKRNCNTAFSVGYRERVFDAATVRRAGSSAPADDDLGPALHVDVPLPAQEGGRVREARLGGLCSTPTPWPGGPAAAIRADTPVQQVDRLRVAVDDNGQLRPRTWAAKGRAGSLAPSQADDARKRDRTDRGCGGGPDRNGPPVA